MSEMVTVDEAAPILGLSRNGALKRFRTGRIPGAKKVIQDGARKWVAPRTAVIENRQVDHLKDFLIHEVTHFHTHMGWGLPDTVRKIAREYHVTEEYVTHTVHTQNLRKGTT